jgi:uncharacterized SAM-binding protein YcdF (DUF218 family)
MVTKNTNNFKYRFKRQLNIIKYLAVILLISGLIATAILHNLIDDAATSDFDHELEYAVILGAGLRDSKPSLTLWYRLQAAAKYLNQYPATKVIVSGGLGVGERYTEAEVMKQFLVELGIDEDRIIKEVQATNTFENLSFAKQLIMLPSAAIKEFGDSSNADIYNNIDSSDNGDSYDNRDSTDNRDSSNNTDSYEDVSDERIKIMIVTSDFHLFRAKMLANRLGFEPYGLPAVTPRVVATQLMVREYLAIIKSFIFDW